MRVAVIDGQGGGIGRHLTERIRRVLGEKMEIVALGTNSTATAVMLKAGANEGATGENAIIQNVGRADVIVGSVAILAAHSMLGEFTPAMAEAVATSPALKLLIPLNRSRIEIAGASKEPLPHLIEVLAKRLKELEGEVAHV